MAGRDGEFEVRLGRIRAASGSRKAVGFLKQVRRGARFRGSRFRGRTQRAVARSQFHRRVTVKASFKRMDAAGVSKLRRHLDYIERDGTDRNGGPAPLYSGDGADVNKDAFVERAKDDRHHFRFIVSPEDAGELKSLTDFTRDLVRQMERDLGTKLDWVAANHYDTGQPHTHLIIRGRRDDGRDLVIPREYIARGLRKRAQELAELELGPVPEIEGRRRLARMVMQERFTSVDRAMFRKAQDGVVDLAATAPRGKLWMRQLEKRRLAHLATLGLTEPLGKGRWRLGENAEATLRRMGERGDIIKAMHRAMSDASVKRAIDGGAVFDPTTAENPVTGAVIARGVADDVNDRAYLVIDSVEGRPRYVEIGSADNLENFRKGWIVTATPANRAPLSSDRTIAEIAAANNGRYSAAIHKEANRSARPEYIQTHIRRLEAMRRAGHATRHPDGSWTVPADYPNRAADFENAKARQRGAIVQIESRQSLAKMQTAIGATWLDRHLHDFDDTANARGFGAELEKARNARLRFLAERGFIAEGQRRLSKETLGSLRADDLDAAGHALSKSIGKPYSRAPSRGRIGGVYRDAIDRPSGRFAVIERAKIFTLVPWRDVMERNRGKMVSGMIRGDGVSWTLTRGRTIS